MGKTIGLPKWVETNNHALTLGVRYGFGEKFKDIDDYTPAQKLVDCSGFFRWDVWHSSGHSVRFPDGSSNQIKHCADLGLSRVPYADAIKARNGYVYACYLPPLWGSAAHIWLTRNGVTWESYGRTHGIGNRRADTLILRVRCSHCYILGKV